MLTQIKIKQVSILSLYNLTIIDSMAARKIWEMMEAMRTEDPNWVELCGKLS